MMKEHRPQTQSPKLKIITQCADSPLVVPTDPELHTKPTMDLELGFAFYHPSHRLPIKGPDRPGAQRFALFVGGFFKQVPCQDQGWHGTCRSTKCARKILSNNHARSIAGTNRGARILSKFRAMFMVFILPTVYGNACNVAAKAYY